MKDFLERYGVKSMVVTAVFGAVVSVLLYSANARMTEVAGQVIEANRELVRRAELAEASRQAFEKEIALYDQAIEIINDRLNNLEQAAFRR